MFSKRNVIVALGCCLIFGSPLVFAADEAADEDTAERCISLSRISRTEVVDDYNILFYMRGDKIYQNRLPHRCPGLKRERRFMYRTSLSQLCDLDIITVLYSAGPGFSPGPSCGLGRFYPISRDEAEALREAPPVIREEGDVPTAEPEAVGESE